MKKIHVFLLCCAVAIAVVGIGFGASKLINRTSNVIAGQSPSSPNTPSEGDGAVRTWFAAELPGAEQLVFRDFNSADDLEKGGVFVYNGTTLESYDGMLDHLSTENGYLEYRYSGDDTVRGCINFFPSFDTKDMTAIPIVAADVVVIDFDMWHPQGTPSTTFSVNQNLSYISFKFTNQYYREFGESGGIGDPVNVYCVCADATGNGDFIQPIIALGDDFSRVLHITVMIFDDRVKYYVDGDFIASTTLIPFNSDGFAMFTVDGFADNVSPDLDNRESLEYGSFCMDNLEMVKFGDGTGSYTGVLANFKTNDSLTIGDIIQED